MENPKVSDRELSSIKEFEELTKEARDAIRKLRPKQQLFVKEYILNLDHIASYIKAGYSKKSAPQNAARLIRDKDVAHAIECALALKIERVAIDRTWIESQYVNLYYEARGRRELGTARQCLHDLGEHHGMFIKKLEVMRTSELETRLLSARRRKANDGAGSEPATIEHDALPVDVLGPPDRPS